VPLVVVVVLCMVCVLKIISVHVSLDILVLIALRSRVENLLFVVRINAIITDTVYLENAFVIQDTLGGNVICHWQSVVLVTATIVEYVSMENVSVIPDTKDATVIKSTIVH